MPVTTNQLFLTELAEWLQGAIKPFQPVNTHRVLAVATSLSTKLCHEFPQLYTRIRRIDPMLPVSECIAGVIYFSFIEVQ